MHFHLPSQHMSSVLSVQDNDFCGSNFYVPTSSSSLCRESKHLIQGHELIEELGNLKLFCTQYSWRCDFTFALPSSGTHTDLIISNTSEGTRSI